MKNNITKSIVFILCSVLILTGCSSKKTEPASVQQNESQIPELANDNKTASEEENNDNKNAETIAIEIPKEETTEIDIAKEEEIIKQYEKDPEEFYSLNDPDLMQYLEDSIYSDLVSRYQSEDVIINNVNTSFVSKEYYEELEYNSKENIFFGYTLSELDNQFSGKRYIFTLGNSGETEVKAFEEYSDDMYKKALKNVAIGSGVILVCVTVSVVSGGLGAAPVSMVFAASAKTGAAMALSAGTFSAAFAGALKGIQTGDMEEALKAAALTGSNSFKWAAIAGALIGGAAEASSLYLSKAVEQVADLPAWRQAELRTLKRYGGKEQLSYLDGKEVDLFTPGATRPDLVRTVGDHLEAIETKFCNLEDQNCVNSLIQALLREVPARIQNLPPGTTQRVVLDITDRGYKKELVESVVKLISLKLYTVYPDIPIDIVGF